MSGAAAPKHKSTCIFHVNAFPPEKKWHSETVFVETKERKSSPAKKKVHFMKREVRVEKRTWSSNSKTSSSSSSSFSTSWSSLSEAAKSFPCACDCASDADDNDGGCKKVTSDNDKLI